MQPKWHFCIALFVVWTVNAFAQSSSCLNRVIEPVGNQRHGDNIMSALDFIQDQYGVAFTYSSSQFDANTSVNWPSNPLTLTELLNSIFHNYQLSLVEKPNCKIILSPKIKKIRFYGYIRDVITGESIIGANLVDTKNGLVHTTDEHGFFSILIQDIKTNIIVSYLGYQQNSINIVHDGKDIYKVISLNFLNELLPIEIQESATDNLLYDPGSTVINIDNNVANKGITGTNDLLNSLKNIDGNNSGGEGELGLYVNGGTSDQNLVFLDGMPLYEVSHIAGISSIFIEETIRSANFIKSHIPARYGGRLSSVINVSLKEGNQAKPSRSVSISPVEARICADGPILDSLTTFNIAVRKSLLNFTVTPFAKSISTFEKIGIDYGDAYAKVSRKSKNNKQLISGTFYLGQDRLRLLNADSLANQNSIFNSFDLNQVRWANSLASMNYRNLLSSRVSMNAQVGWLAYNNSTRGLYKLFSQSPVDTINRSLDVQTRSKINDIQLTGDLDYYFDEYLKFKSGFAITHHSFNPGVKQATLFIDNEPEITADPNITINALEWTLYAEANIRKGDLIYLYPGLNVNNFNVEGRSFITIQPRFTLLLTPNDKTLISASYARLAQNVNILTNPGVGIASDLWVPSTRERGPATSTQWNVEIKQQIHNGFFIVGSWYNKNFNNIIEYDQPIDLHANVVIKNSNNIFFNNQSQWRQNLQVGSGNANGYSASIRKENGSIKGFISYHHTNVRRTFSNINEGNTFIARNDRPVDINVGMTYQPNAKWSFFSKWVYTSGTTFSLPNEGYQSPLGINLIQPNERNNYRLPPFHQLSIGAEKSFIRNTYNGTITFGLYNAYDRRNPFYIYATNNPGESIPTLKKVSILPIFPIVNFKLNW